MDKKGRSPLSFISLPHLLLLSLLCFAVLSFTPLVFASSRKVSIWLAGDEEFESYAQRVYWYSGQTLAYLWFYQAFGYFSDAFGVSFYFATYVQWDSGDALTDSLARLNEVISETGFSRSSEHPIMIAFTGQDITDAFGVAPLDWTKSTVLVESWSEFTVSIIQHEVSHLYGAIDEWSVSLDCVMNVYPTYYGFPYFMTVPYAVTTHNWCETSKNTINGNIERFGYLSSSSYGGGGGGIWNPVFLR